MFLKLVSLEKLRELIHDQRDMPDLYDVTHRGSHSVHLSRDNYEGLEPLVQHIATCFGMTIPHLQSLDNRLGWVLVSQKRS
jgi:hypothetical protein